MEWLTDKNGKRYRKIGNIIEYEPEIMTTNGSIPMSMIGEEVKTEPIKKEKFMLCPFKDLLQCSPKCVFRSGDQCTFGQHKEKPGTICPFSGMTCSQNCALYDQGCRF